MANINEVLKKNNYGDIIVPLVNAYNATQKVVPNPHEVNLVASLLHLRTQTFGGNISVTDIEELVNAGVRGTIFGLLFSVAILLMDKYLDVAGVATSIAGIAYGLIIDLVATFFTRKKREKVEKVD